jgi:hypothetical protein
MPESGDTDPDDRPGLYVHLGFDGGIFVVRDSGQSGWVTQAELERELDAFRRRPGGVVLYSRDQPEADPPPLVERTFRLIIDRKLPVRLLLEPNPAVVAFRQTGATVLMRAAYANDVAAVGDLVARGVPLEARDPDGMTALMYAANRGAVRAAATLVDAGADVNAADAQGSTPLMFAAQGGFEKVVRLLLAHGADPGRRGSHGLTAEEFARQNGHRAVGEMIAQDDRGMSDSRL